MSTPPKPDLILIVDDDEDIRWALTDALRHQGFSTAEAVNGREALELLVRAGPGAGRPNLVLLDMMMPVMNGIEFLVERRKDPDIAAIPVIVLTAANLTLRADLRPDVAGCVVKPVEVDTLVALVQRCLTPPA